MRLKQGVMLKGLTVQGLVAMLIARDVMHRYGYECTVTSANDSKHSEASLHYQGKAIDVRSKDIRTQEEKRLILSEMRRDFGSEFDVLIEGEGTANEHFHIEWDPD